LSLFKGFALPLYSSHIEIRAGVLTVFNHPSFGDLNDSITGSNAVGISSSRFRSILPAARVLEVAGQLVFKQL
jgi:hypothetical protein